MIFARRPIKAILLVCWLLCCCDAIAQPAMERGVQLYSAGRYEEAAVVFKECIGKFPKNPNSLYYYALCQHQLRNINGATAAYKQLISLFPTSLAAGQAQQALQIITKGGVLRSAERDAPDYDSLPQDAVVYFQRDETSALLVDGYINNRQITMVFDTGAETCAFGKNHLQQLGLKLPEGEPVGRAVGVGSQGTVPFWRMTVDLKVGPILRKNMEVLVQEKLLTPPLLGQTFFRDFRYTVDSGANSIRFTKKPRLSAIRASNATSGSARSYGSSHDPNAVPFVREGDTIRVMAEVNGRPCKMIFDTGASRTVFSFDQLKRLGISVPEDAEEEVHKGVAGESKGAGFEISQIKLGPIERRSFRISAVYDIGINDPLLGQTFLSSWQYTIDYTNKVIRFVRR